ncbi:MAG: nucleotidyl transferase AbiEii/AbiGii toxin family protein [Candidatus Micrarchaeota archaeon]
MNEISGDLLREYAGRQKLPAALVEKDYALSVALLFISKVPIAQNLVFKGGTALRKAYFSDYRLSADLDFSSSSTDGERIKLGFFGLQGKKFEGISFKQMEDKSISSKDSLNLRAKYQSKISTIEGKAHIESIKIEINFKNRVLLDPSKRRIKSPSEYQLEEFNMPTMQLEEILAEKIHAIFNRVKPRDLYDLHYLLESGCRFDLPLVNKKLSLLGRKFEFAPFSARVMDLAGRWKIDMQGLLPAIPSFEKIANATLMEIEKQSA